MKRYSIPNTTPKWRPWYLFSIYSHGCTSINCIVLRHLDTNRDAKRHCELERWLSLLFHQVGQFLVLKFGIIFGNDLFLHFCNENFVVANNVSFATIKNNNNNFIRMKMVIVNKNTHFQKLKFIANGNNFFLFIAKNVFPLKIIGICNGFSFHCK